MTTTSSPRPRAALVGAGIVGLATARALQKAGHDVTLIDPEEPGSGASFGNAGLIAGSAVVPEASPAMLRAIPGMLIKSDGPITISPRYLPRMGRFLWHFAKASAPSNYDRLSRGMAALSLNGYGHWMALLDDSAEGALFFVRTAASISTCRTANGAAPTRPIPCVASAGWN